MSDRTFLEILWSGARPLLALLGLTGLVAIAHKSWKRSTLRLLSRGVDYRRAAVFQVVDCCGGARLRLNRWPEHLDRARRER